MAENILVPINESAIEHKSNLFKAENQRKQYKQEKYIELFRNQGFIFKDNIYGSASGRFNYIYRSKGSRIFWFNDGLIRYSSIYSTIDNYGYSYSTEELDTYNIFKESTDIEVIMGSPLDEIFQNGEILISNLININENFIKDYALEYLLSPPDVARLSNFSIQIREQIWDTVIELIKEAAILYNDQKLSLLRYLTEFSKKHNISPSAYHVTILFDFYRENHKKINSHTFQELMSFIRQSSEPQNNVQQKMGALALINELENIESGKEMAHVYHNLIFRCLNYIFGDELKRGKKEVKVDKGIKRIDIVFDNFDKDGFFAHIRDRYNIYCPKIFIECKNYSSDPTNQDIDQLIGRLSDVSGKFGILICRQLQNEEKLLERCIAARNNKQEFVIYLLDQDIKKLLKLKEEGNNAGLIDYLSKKWDRLILNN